VGFEPTIPVLERAKTVHALDRAATLIGKNISLLWVLSAIGPIANSATSTKEVKISVSVLPHWATMLVRIFLLQEDLLTH
jgi:hypothetical protein